MSSGGVALRRERERERAGPGGGASLAGLKSSSVGCFMVQERARREGEARRREERGGRDGIVTFYVDNQKGGELGT